MLFLYIFVCFYFAIREMKSLSDDNQADIIEAYNSTSMYLSLVLD